MVSKTKEDMCIFPLKLKKINIKYKNSYFINKNA